jgi:hypothetical protein
MRLRLHQCGYALEPARHGTARHGTARHGTARHGTRETSNSANGCRCTAMVL